MEFENPRNYQAFIYQMGVGARETTPRTTSRGSSVSAAGRR